MRKTLIAAGLGLALTLGAAGCGGKAISQDELADRIKSVTPSIDPRIADCVAEEIYPTLSEDEKKALDDKDADEETQRSLARKSVAAGTTCGKRLAPTSPSRRLAPPPPRPSPPTSP